MSDPCTMCLYDNHNGYKDDALHIMNKVSVFIEEIIRDYDEYSALEISALAHAAVEEAFCGVSIERRLQ